MPMQEIVTIVRRFCENASGFSHCDDHVKSFAEGARRMATVVVGAFATSTKLYHRSAKSRRDALPPELYILPVFLI